GEWRPGVRTVGRGPAPGRSALDARVSNTSAEDQQESIQNAADAPELVEPSCCPASRHWRDLARQPTLQRVSFQRHALARGLLSSRAVRTDAENPALRQW